jgi:acetyl-CoA synthetase
MSQSHPDFEKIYESFEWDKVLETYDWDAPEELNIAHEACDRHAGSGRTGFRWVDDAGTASEYTFAELHDASNRIANALTELGIGPGDRMAVLLPKIPETILTVLGIWKTGAIHVPLFSAFEKQALEYRINDCQPKVLVFHVDHGGTVDVLDIDNDPQCVAVGDGDPGTDAHSFENLIDAQSDSFDVVRTAMDDSSTIQYTSGTTGPPKGVVMTHKCLAILYPHTKYALDINESDLVWGAADPAWSYGLFTSGFAPMSLGASRLLHAGEFDPDHWVEILDEQGVTVMGAAPSVYRGIAAASEEVLKGRSFDDLRVVSSAGEPLNPGTYNWFEEHLDLPIHDTYGLTEATMPINNYAGLDMELKPGSMGRPAPGFEVTLLDPETREPVGTDEIGEIALRPREWMFIDEYWGMPERTEETFHDGWLLTDDLARVDNDGYYWYEGRNDDVIISSGYRIGPFEVESSLMEHNIVAEAAAIGVPDENRGQRVKAFVVQQEEPADVETVREDLKSHVKERMARHAYPREVKFVDELPITETGKIQRYKLREEENE